MTETAKIKMKNVKINRSNIMLVCWWMCFFVCHTVLASDGYTYRRPVAINGPTQHKQAATMVSGRILNSQQIKTGTPVATNDGLQLDDQSTSDTIGINFGFGVGLDTPMIDSLLDRLLRRKQILMAAAAAAATYPGPGWGPYSGVGGGIGSGFYSNPGNAVFPYGGGVGPWNRPIAYPYPFVPPSLNPFGGGFGGLGGVGGWNTFNGVGFNPLNDFDNDFGWKDNTPK